MTSKGESDPILIKSITPDNILSFGPETKPISFGALNVLIGPNGSGKSNLIDCIALMRSTARDMRGFIRTNGGVEEWIWKGDLKQSASIEMIVANQNGGLPLRHGLSFSAGNSIFHLEKESIYEIASNIFYFDYVEGIPFLNISGNQRQLFRDRDIKLDESILVQRRDPERYPEITYLADSYEKIRIYREWQFGRNSVFRTPQKADGRNDRIEEDFSNLGLFLNRLKLNPPAKKMIIEGLAELYEGIDDFDVSVVGGTVQVFFTEENFTIPATRLSDGTLRYLCLLAILCDPNPPKLICIEEPELGLHPDVLPKLAGLFIKASERTQLIVTTHSDIIVDALSDHAESILVCNKKNGYSEIERLNVDKLKIWLKDYRLGELWMNGELGGTRW